MRFRIIPTLGLVIFWLLISFTSKHQPRVLSFDDFEPHLHLTGDSLYLVNFWATWCTPCVEEIPAFEKINQEYKDKKVKVLLVSLDFPKRIESRLVPFLEDHDVRSEVIVLDDPDANKWINRVHSDWSGSIPATVVYSKNGREFHEGTFTYDELKTLVENKLTEL